MSNYTWLYEFLGTKAEKAGQALVEWCAAFEIPGGFMSDGPSHFKNETMRILCKSLRVPHHFTLPYCPWSNGAVERLGREIISMARAVFSELQLRHETWPDLIPIIQLALKNTVSRHRGNVAPITAFTGLPPTPPIATFLRCEDGKPVSVSEAIQKRALI